MKALIQQFRCRGVWAMGRWALIAWLLPLIWACNARTFEPGQSRPSQVVTGIFPTLFNQKIDILFMIDNSESMAPLQAKLLDNFPVFMNVLESLPTGDASGAVGLPDIHVAVVSSDTGPGIYDLADSHCRHDGDEGLFQTAPRGGCPVSPLHVGQTFLAASGNQAQKNYDGDITDAFTCIAALGEGGCGFEGQLKSVRWALDPFNVPPGNQGFLRTDAALAVILITNEDDCSVPDDSDLIDPSSQLVSDPYGPFDSFRCNEFGHLCTDPNHPTGPLVPPVRGANTDLTGCVSNDTSSGRETHVADEIAFLKSLKADPSQILVAAITGPATPYSVQMVSQTTTRGTELEPVTVHSCQESSGEYADPAVRIQQWIEGFGGHGILLPICADNFAPALEQIANSIVPLLAPCVQGTIQADAAGHPKCVVDEHYTDEATGRLIDTPLPACAESQGVLPCWSLSTDATKCSGAQILNITRAAGAPANNLDTQISCSLCVKGQAQPGCP
jgi:hypothetical protein